jgi:hypothetical protein
MHQRHVAQIVFSLGLGLSLCVATACQTAPFNGTTAAGPVIGKSFLFQGFWNEPSEVISLQVMVDPTRDPALATSWVQFATAVSSTTPTLVNRPDPLFQWSVNAVPVPNATVAARWPQGGLVRVRAVHRDPAGDTVLFTFDDSTFNACLGEQLNAGADWVTIGTVCQGLGNDNAALVSTTDVPVAQGTAAGGGGFLGRKGTIAANQTAAYYQAIGAPTTLAAFRAQFGFPTGEVSVTYYNDTDLALGRELHCKEIADRGVACFVTNYTGVAGTAVFDRDPNTVLADAVARVRPFATLAIIHDGGTSNNSAKFIAYNAAGNLATTVQLDSTGNNKSIPNSCLSCHGISSSFSAASNAVDGNAKLLPLDPFNFKYSTAAGFTFNDQADKIRRINAMVKVANPSLGIAQFIAGLYAPLQVTDPGAPANNTFIPDAWKTFNNNLDGTSLYNGVVKVGCRTCHISATVDALDFDAPSDFKSLLAAIRTDVCSSSHIMPHSERTMRKFWESGARAFLVTGFPPATFPDALQACKP